MKTDIAERQAVESFEILKEIEIAAPIEIAFEATMEQLGAECQMPGGKPFPMKIEAKPGGRWYRDLGNDAGHLWGHVQVIKPPALLEIYGPLMISNASANHLQWRLKAEGTGTRLSFSHRAIGLFPPEHREGLQQGWGYWVERVGELAEAKKRKAGGQ
jgi:uncharacterized protein YndB with AHSA1/START domain